MSKKTNIVCRGYGSPHGFAHGRHWFVCSECRWPSRAPEDYEPKKKYVPCTFTKKG